MSRAADLHTTLSCPSLSSTIFRSPFSNPYLPFLPHPRQLSNSTASTRQAKPCLKHTKSPAASTTLTSASVCRSLPTKRRRSTVLTLYFSSEETPPPDYQPCKESQHTNKRYAPKANATKMPRPTCNSFTFFLFDNFAATHLTIFSHRESSRLQTTRKGHLQYPNPPPVVSSNQPAQPQHHH